MESALRLLTKEALKDNNFGQTFFETEQPEEESVIAKSDLSKPTKLQFKIFARQSEFKIRKQVKETKLLMSRFLVSAVEEYDDVMTGMHLEPHFDNAEGGKDSPDPDKIFKTYPSFDPVFMKV